MKLIQEGPRDAKIVLVGEAPGSTEAVTGVPFSGGSGDLLNRMLSRCGISRSECFITNVAHVQPPGNDFFWFLKPKPKLELMQGVVQLKKDLDDIRPNLVVALGAQPLRFLTDKVSISKWRGSILETTLTPGLKVIATYHPAHILRNWDYKVVAELDLRRCREQSAYADVRRKKRELVLGPSRADTERLVADLSKADWLAVDIECFETPSGWRLACCGFADSAGRAVVIPNDSDWQKEAIRSLCGCPAKKILQNGTFDKTVLEEESIPLVNFAWDTMLAHHSMYPECASGDDEMAKLDNKKKKQGALPKGLSFLTSIYTDIPFYKDDGKLWKQTGDLQMFWGYNGLDCVSTFEVKEKQDGELDELGVRHVFDHEMWMLPPLTACTKRGIKINAKLKEELRVQYETEIGNLHNALDLVAGQPVNVKSPPQMQALLYDKFKLPVQRKRRKPGQEPTITCDKDAIVALAEKHPHPFLRIILEIRKRRDFIERYINVKLDADGRIRCAFDVTGTNTGRLSSRKSIYGSGTNLQNIPVRKPEGEGIRRMFEADEGKVFVYRDYSQAEARVVAYLSGATGLIELFEDPTRDIHKENAARIFGKPVGDVTDVERYLAKRVVHACNYGMEADRLVQVVNEDADVTGIRIDRKQAADLIYRYFLLYPEIRETYWKEVKNELTHSRTLISAFGRKRTFYGRWDDKLMRDAYSFIPQSTVGDLGAKALARCYYEIEPIIPGSETLLNVHDSVMMQCWKGDEQRVAAEMQRVMDMPMTVRGHTFTIPTDCKIGLNWSNRPKKNPDINPHGLIDLDKWIKEAA